MAISVEHRNFFIPRVFNASAEGFPFDIFTDSVAPRSDAHTSWSKNFEDMTCIRLDTVPQPDGQTEG